VGGRAEWTAVTKTNVASAAASGGVLGVGGDALDTFASYVTRGVDFGVVAYVTGA